MAFDYTQPLFVAGVAAFGAVVGYFGKRIISNERDREAASLFNTHAQIAATLKAQGITTDDADDIAVFLKNKERHSRKKETEDPDRVRDDLSFPAYWTQRAINLRAGASANIAEAQLGASIAELDGLMTEEEAEAFRAAQEAWEAYVEKQVDFAGSQVSGGSMEPLIRSSERENLLGQRNVTVKSFIEQFKSR